MHVVAQKPCRATLQTSRASGQTITLKLRLCDIVVGTNGNRAERSRVSIRRALVIHGYIEETRCAQGFACRFDLFQMPAEGFFPFNRADHRLESCPPPKV